MTKGPECFQEDLGHHVRRSRLATDTLSKTPLFNLGTDMADVNYCMSAFRHTFRMDTRTRRVDRDLYMQII